MGNQSRVAKETISGKVWLQSGSKASFFGVLKRLCPDSGGGGTNPYMRSNFVEVYTLFKNAYVKMESESVSLSVLPNS